MKEKNFLKIIIKYLIIIFTLLIKNTFEIQTDFFESFKIRYTDVIILFILNKFH